MVRQYEAPLDLEVAGLLSAALAYGRVDLFKPRLAALLKSLGPHPGALARDLLHPNIFKICEGFSYRMTGPAEVAALLAGAGALAREQGTLGAAFAGMFARTGEPTVRGALGLFVEALLAGPGPASRRLKHLLPHPARGSACKRLNLFLRWMVRGPDGVDLGLWRAIPPAALVIPLDTHVHRIAGLVGLTRRPDLSWATAEEITSRLRALDPADPVRFDFPSRTWASAAAAPRAATSASARAARCGPSAATGAGAIAARRGRVGARARTSRAGKRLARGQAGSVEAPRRVPRTM